MHENVKGIYDSLCNRLAELLLFLNHILPLFNKLTKKFKATESKTSLDCNIKADYIQETKVCHIQYRNPVNFCNINDIFLGHNVSIFLQNS